VSGQPVDTPPPRSPSQIVVVPAVLQPAAAGVAISAEAAVTAAPAASALPTAANIFWAEASSLSARCCAFRAAGRDSGTISAGGSVAVRMSDRSPSAP